MTTLLQRMHDELVRRNYAATTIRTYLHALRTCERYHRGRRLDQLGAQARRRYHAHLFREKKLAVGTVGLHVAALRFFLVRVLKRRELKEELPTPKRHRRLPTVLSPDEVRRQAFVGELVDDRQAFQRATVGAGVEDEVVGPDVIGRGRRERPWPARGDAPSRTTPRHLQLRGRP